MTVNLLHISDCHLVADGASLLGVDTQQTLEWVLAGAMADRSPDAIVAGGDIAHDPELAVYERFLDTVRQVSDAPLLVLPGNHDVLATMRAAGLPDQPLTIGTWGLVGLDSHEDEKTPALVLEADKQATQRDMHSCSDVAHVLLATHHHLLPVNCPWLDPDGVQNAQDLLKWLWQASANRLRGCIFGHVHQEVEGMVAIEDQPLNQIPVWGVPSTCFQFLPRSPAFSVDALGPGYRWLYLYDDGSVGTEVKRIQQTIEVDMSKFKH